MSHLCISTDRQIIHTHTHRELKHGGLIYISAGRSPCLVIALCRDTWSLQAHRCCWKPVCFCRQLWLWWNSDKKRMVDTGFLILNYLYDQLLLFFCIENHCLVGLWWAASECFNLVFLVVLIQCIFSWLFVCKQAVTAMVQQAMQYIDETPDVDTRIELIKTLNSVSAGKVVVWHRGCLI